MEKFYAGGFLYNPDARAVLLHKRDGNTSINPHKWAFFGGSSEGGETPVLTFIREVQEELNVVLSEAEVLPLRDYPNAERMIHRYVFYAMSKKQKSEMTLGEGAEFEWIPLSEVFSYDVTAMTADDLRFFIERL